MTLSPAAKGIIIAAATVNVIQIVVPVRAVTFNVTRGVIGQTLLAKTSSFVISQINLFLVAVLLNKQYLPPKFQSDSVIWSYNVLGYVIKGLWEYKKVKNGTNRLISVNFLTILCSRGYFTPWQQKMQWKKRKKDENGWKLNKTT